VHRLDDRGCSKLSKEGSPRAAFARETGAGQKPTAERGNCVGPSLGGFGPCCIFEEAIRRRCSVILLGGELMLLDVTASRAKARQRKRREGLARGSAKDAAEGVACWAERARSDTDSRSSCAWKGTTKVATFTTGTAARSGVPVRQAVLQNSMTTTLLLSPSTTGKPKADGGNEARPDDFDEERSVGRAGWSSARRGKLERLF